MLVTWKPCDVQDVARKENDVSYAKTIYSIYLVIVLLKLGVIHGRLLFVWFLFILIVAEFCLMKKFNYHH